MKHLVSLIALALVVAACSNSSNTADTSTTQATTTTTVATTTSTIVATTTTSAPSAADLVQQLAAGFEGTYEGEWRNLTFGSSGPISTTVTAGSDGLTIDSDLGGNVFGAADPDPESFTLAYSDLATGTLTGESPLFGPFTMTVNESGYSFEASAVPSAGIASMTVTGSFDGDTISGTYEISFDGGGGAEGEFEVSRTS